jgi:GTP cyclohydrolase FolE2
MQANYSMEAKEKHSSTSKGGTTNVDVIVQTVQLDKNDDECIRIGETIGVTIVMMTKVPSAKNTSQPVELLHCR